MNIIQAQNTSEQNMLDCAWDNDSTIEVETNIELINKTIPTQIRDIDIQVGIGEKDE